MSVVLQLFNEKSGLSDFGVTDDEMERMHLRNDTSLETKLQRIRDGTTDIAIKKKRKISENTSISNWWKWYWQQPTARLPFLYFVLTLCSVPALSTFWWMDQDSAFILSGVIGICIFMYAIHRFRILIGLKKQINKYKELNLEFKKDVLAVKAELARVRNAHSNLRKTKHRITRANANNRKNLNRFELISKNMQIVGEKQAKGMTNIHETALEMKTSWRHELLTNERALLHSAYARFETTGHRDDGVTYDQFIKLSRMLPKRYSKRFRRMGTFDTFAHGGSVIDFRMFTNAIDLYATMEVDNVDLDPTPYVTPSHTPSHSSHVHLQSPFHTPMHSPFHIGIGMHDHPHLSALEFSYNRSAASDDNHEMSMSHFDDHSQIRDDSGYSHKIINSASYTEMRHFLPQ
eukprot:96250_1